MTPPVNGPDLLRSRQVLVIEDDHTIAALVQELLVEFGCVPAGVAHDIESAMRHAVQTRFDVALLDVNLGGHEAWPIADAMLARGRRFVFVTGSDTAVLSRYADVPSLRKPFRAAMLRDALIDALATAPPTNRPAAKG